MKPELTGLEGSRSECGGSEEWTDSTELWVLGREGRLKIELDCEGLENTKELWLPELLGPIESGLEAEILEGRTVGVEGAAVGGVEVPGPSFGGGTLVFGGLP